MVKIIFSDFDHTMLDYYSKDNYFDDYKIGVLKKVQERGIKFCIVTGRSVSFFFQFPNLLEVIDYIAGSNGACIYDVKAKKFLYHDVIYNKELNDIIQHFISCNYYFLLNCKDKRYKYGTWDGTDCLDYQDNCQYFCEQLIVKVKENCFDELFSFLEQFDDIRINNMNHWNDYWTIDINKGNISKGKAVSLLCNYLDIDLEKSIAFGDGDNDKSMFEVVNKGISVLNANDKLKVLSNDLALECKDNGIYKYIDDNILK